VEADDRFTVEIEPGQRWIEAGVASWDPGDGSAISVRHHVLKPDGGFDPYSSARFQLNSWARWWMCYATTSSTPDCGRPGSPPAMRFRERWADS